jgi:hypothetical protein
MVTWAVFWVPPVQGAGRFTTVVCPDPDGLQTSGVTVIGARVGARVGVGTAVGVGDGVGVGVGGDAEWATQPDRGRGVDAGDGTPAAVTTLPNKNRPAIAASPVALRREKIARLRAHAGRPASPMGPDTVRPV